MNTNLEIFANLCRLIWLYFKQATQIPFNKVIDFDALLGFMDAFLQHPIILWTKRTVSLKLELNQEPTNHLALEVQFVR